MAFKLPRLDRFTYLVDNRHIATMAFSTFWDRFASTLESTIASLSTTVTDLSTAQANITTLQTQILQALSSMPDIPDLHISADYTGTPDAGTLPAVVSAKRFTGTTDDTANATWSFTVVSGGVTASISSGILTITDISATSVITITSNYHGFDVSRTFTVYLDLAPPPPTSSPPTGTSTVSDSSLNSITGTTLVPISDELTVTVGSSGTVSLTAPKLVVSTAGGAANHGTYNVSGEWEWWNGSAWVLVGSLTAASPPCSVASFTGSVSNGSLTINTSKTGLTPGSSGKFRVTAKKTTSSTQTITFAGTVTATSS